MSEKVEKYNFIVVKYPQADTAEAALGTVLELAKQKVVKLKDAVAITKTEKGKIKLRQTKDDPAGKGLLKGGLIGLLFALLFGPAGWIVAGAALGTAFAMFDRGIKNKLLKELGEEMTSDESALALLIVEADWDTLNARMDAKYSGEVVISQMVEDHLEEAEELVENEAVAETVPEELEIGESTE
ncbi:MAG: DUF1269 domain-containing protein [Chloroflexota bacterium]|nr:MAG: DUF1269 domain-containing protein [Chloroflexota bacterium]